MRDEVDSVEALGLSRDAYANACATLWTPEPDPEEPLSVWNARAELLRIVGATVALTRPHVVVETGVALGFTTATILRAMEDVGVGRLYSIDLPAIQHRIEVPVGQAVPDDLRSRWELLLGDSRRLLPMLAARVAPIDIFVHDSLHTYSTQMREFRTVWPSLRPGGFVICDDVDNPAILDFGREVGVESVLVRSASRPSAVGVLRRPGYDRTTTSR